MGYTVRPVCFTTFVKEIFTGQQRHLPHQTLPQRSLVGTSTSTPWSADLTTFLHRRTTELVIQCKKILVTFQFRQSLQISSQIIWGNRILKGFWPLPLTIRNLLSLVHLRLSFVCSKQSRNFSLSKWTKANWVESIFSRNIDSAQDLLKYAQVFTFFWSQVLDPGTFREMGIKNLCASR